MSEIKRYIKLSKGEFYDLIFVTIILSIMFSMSKLIFSQYNSNLLEIFIIFSIFIFILLFLRIKFMKLVGYRNAFEIIFRKTYFDRYWIKKWDRISYWFNHWPPENLKLPVKRGFPVGFISLFLYIISLGFFIYPAIWNNSIKKIPHLHFGTRQKFEYQMNHMYNIEISDYRYSKALFFGFLYYLLLAILVKIFFEESNLYFWFEYIIIWTAIISIIPIFGNEGYELFSRNNFAWISILTILCVGFSTLFLFDSIISILLTTIFISIIIIFYLFWRKLVK